MKNFPGVNKVFLIKTDQDLIFDLDEANNTLKVNADAFDITEISQLPEYSELSPFSVILHNAIFDKINSIKTERVSEEQLIVNTINQSGVIPYFHNYKVYILQNGVAIWLVLEP